MSVAPWSRLSDCCFKMPACVFTHTGQFTCPGYKSKTSMPGLQGNCMPSNKMPGTGLGLDFSIAPEFRSQACPFRRRLLYSSFKCVFDKNRVGVSNCSSKTSWPYWLMPPNMTFPAHQAAAAGATIGGSWAIPQPAEYAIRIPKTDAACRC